MNQNINTYFLHEQKNLLSKCLDLLDEEWKLSTTARMHMLEKSCSELPCSIILVEENDKERVIGHSRISRMHNDPQKCYISSVIITKRLRGKGLGKYLMLKTEELAKSYGFSYACLTTKDKQGFYEHLGYTYVFPDTHNQAAIQLLKSGIFSDVLVYNTNCINSPNKKSSHEQISNVPPPPPPPPILNSFSPVKNLHTRVSMEKQLI